MQLLYWIISFNGPCIRSRTTARRCKAATTLLSPTCLGTRVDSKSVANYCFFYRVARDTRTIARPQSSPRCPFWNYCREGCSASKLSMDKVRKGIHIQFKATFAPRYALLVPLQDSSADMGATAMHYVLVSSRLFDSSNYLYAQTSILDYHAGDRMWSKTLSEITKGVSGEKGTRVESYTIPPAKCRTVGRNERANNVTIGFEIRLKSVTRFISLQFTLRV